jgi:hypothetical protein
MFADAASSLGSNSRRAISRSLRFTRLRSTTRLPCFGTTAPNREREAGEDA